VTIKETVDARKQQFGPDDLDALFDGARKVIVGRGKKHQVFDLAAKDFDRAAFLEFALGPTGKLRAPAVKAGKTWLVGFNPDAWGGVFG
jgi:hypothetical protein